MKSRQWLPLVVLLPGLAYCGGDGTSQKPGPDPGNGGEPAGGEGPSAGKPSGGASAGNGGKPSGGSGTAGTGATGGADGNAGMSAQGGAAQAGASTEPGVAGDAGSDAGGQGGSDSGGPLTFFDYYYRESSGIHWLSSSGSGKLADLAQRPLSFRFAEGDVDGQGKVTARRASVLYLEGGKLYRLEGSAYANEAPAPVRVSTLSGVSDICFAQVVSDLADRSQSFVWFQYETTGACAGLGIDEERPTVLVPLTAGAATAPTPLDYRLRPLVGPTGKLEASLLLTPDQRLIRTKSLTDATEEQLLVAATVHEVEALSLGAARFLLMITRGNAELELFVFDAATHVLSASLGKFSNVSYPVASGLLRNDTHAFFVGTPSGDNQNHIYRFPVSGASAPAALAGIGPTTAAVSLVGLTADRLIYRQTAPLTAGIYSLPPAADFGAPPAAATIVGKNVFPRLVSETRLFYQDGNLAKVINLDASHDEYYSLDGNLSYWIGCTTDPESDVPASRQRTGNCQRVYAEGLGAGLKGGKVVSYDADADAGQAFFGSPARATREHGALPDELVQQTMLVDASRSGYNPFQTSSNSLVTGTFLARPTINDPDRYAVFYLTDPSQTASSVATFLSPADSIVWLSRGPD